MAFTATLEKTRKDLERTLADPTPLFAVVGAGDLAVEKLREARAELAARAAKFDAKAFRTQAQTLAAASFEAVQADVTARFEAAQADAKTAPAQFKAAPVKAQAAVNEALAAALTVYGELAGRGKKLVTSIRKQQATVELEKQVKTTVSKAKGTTTSAKKAAATTKRSAKGTTTSAKKATTAAKKAASDAAAKVGN